MHPRCYPTRQLLYGAVSAKRKKRRDRKQLRQHCTEPKRIWVPPGELQEVEEPNRLAYSRKQAAEALGVSISTIDRHLVRAVNTVKTPWGQRLIPVAELERFLQEHLQPPREPSERGTPGRPPSLPPSIVERIRLQYARGRGLADIARALSEDGVPTAHGGRQWWPSTVRTVLVRSSSVASAEVRERAA
jgi:Recombinase